MKEGGAVEDYTEHSIPPEWDSKCLTMMGPGRGVCGPVKVITCTRLWVPGRPGTGCVCVLLDYSIQQDDVHRPYIYIYIYSCLHWNWERKAAREVQ